MGSQDNLDQVRLELRRMGYLDHSVERLLLQDALKPAGSVRTWLALAGRVGLIGGGLAALFSTLVLAAWNGHLSSSPFDLLPLFLHLAPPMVLGLALVFLGLAALLIVVLRLSHWRRIGTLSTTVAALAVATLSAAGLWQGQDLWGSAAAWQLGLLVLALPMVAYGLFQVIHGGLLALSVRMTERAPSRPSSPHGWIALVLLLLTLLTLLPAILDLGTGLDPLPSSLPMLPLERVLLIGVDGVLPGELDYLLASGELPEIERRLDHGGVLLSYPRPEGPPAAFWTTVGTGLPAAGHGLVSLDSFRPAGLSRPLYRSGWLRPWWALVAEPLGLAEYRAVLSQSRRGWAFWELAASGEAPAVVVNWWGTFPAEPLAGLVVAHGAYQMLGDATAGAVEPAMAEAGLRQLRDDLELEASAPRLAAALPGLRAALPKSSYAELVAAALKPDEFYRRVFARALSADRPRAAALYLPALDIAATLTGADGVAQADLLRWQLEAVDRLVAEAGDIGTVVLVFDPGRRGVGRGGVDQGRVLLWRRDGCAAENLPSIEPEVIAASLLRALGLPQSRELPEPPALCNWPAASLTLDTFGHRRATDAVERSEEYLENLRSLGYL